MLNASPDFRQQIEVTTALQPWEGLRSKPIGAVALTGSDVDVVAGLLTMRERQAISLYATRRVLNVLDTDPIFEVLARDVVARREISLDTPFEVLDGLTVKFFAVPGKVPLYLEMDDSPEIETNDQTVAAAVSDGRVTLFFIPGCAAMPPALAERLRAAALVLFDGTLWSDDEMIRAGLGPKTGARMEHMSVSELGGTMAAFEGLGVERWVFDPYQ